MKPIVSIIIPAYNAGKFLGECLNSVRTQTFPDFECLIVDDGSTDDTAAIACQYIEKDSRFKLLSQSNGGVSKARNLGIDKASGEFVSFVDADDLLHPEALKAMHDCLTRYGADVCITAFLEFENQITGEIKFPKALRADVEIYDYESAMRVALYQKRIFNSPWGALMKRSLLHERNRFREGTRYEDLDAFYRFYEEAGKIVYLPFAYYYYRKNPDSFLNNWSTDRLDVLDVTDRMVEFFSANHPSLLKGAQDRRFSAHFNMLLLLKKYKVADKAAAERCRRVIRQGRLRAITDPRVRLKNKIGALLFPFI